MAGLRMRAAVGQFRVLLSHGVRHSRCSVCAYSAAPQQRSTGDQTTSDGGADAKSCAVRSLERKNMKLEEEIRDLTERCRIAVADSESVRKRTQNFLLDAKLFGIQSFCRDMVEVADILEQSVNETQQKGMKDAFEILSSIEGKLQSIFTKHGLQKMTPVGEPYDPYDHEIVSHVPAEGRKPGSVAIIQQDGYKLHGRTIRHARVRIALETQA